MTDAELRDAAVAALKRTSISFPAWQKKLASGGYPDVSVTEWWKAFDALGKIGVAAPPPSPSSVVYPPRIASSSGPTGYCSPAGSDATGAGTVANPWKTLSKGWASIPAGGTLLLRGGVYVDRVDPLLAWGGTATAVKTIASYPGEIAVYQRFIRFDPAQPVSYVRFQDIEFHGVLTKPGEDSIVYGRSGSHIEFLRCNIHHQNLGSAMVVEPACVDWQWWDCLIHHNGRPSTNLDHGLYLEGHRFVVARCTIFENSAYGVQLWPSATECLIAECSITGNGKQSPAATIGQQEFTGGVVVAGNSPGATRGNRILHNTISDNTGFALKTNSAVTAADGNVAVGNTMVGNTEGVTSFYHPNAIAVS